MKHSGWTFSLLGILVALLQPLPARSQSSADRSADFLAKGIITSDFSVAPGVPPSSLSPQEVANSFGDTSVANDLYSTSRRFDKFDLTPEVIQPADVKFNWRSATRQSMLFTGMMHSFNLATEAGTRDTLNGHWFSDYISSVSELRGWSDGDKFMSPYVGHTIEGSVFGFIERQNNPKDRLVQWGDGRDYFASLLRSMAFSAVWHTQWKIGPISEASIGNVMLHASPGFICLADTPTLGTVAMIGEDAADRYLIMGIENRTANPALIMLIRSFLNPGRSVANAMAFRVPWDRDTRMGIFGQNHTRRKEMLRESKVEGGRAFEFKRLNPPESSTESKAYPLEAPIELEAFPYYERSPYGGNCVGGGGSGAARVTRTWQAVAELNGCLIMNMPQTNQSGDSLFYGGGLRWTPAAAHRWSPFAEVLFGGKKVTHETDDLALRKKLLAEWNDGSGTLKHYPKRSDWSVEISNNGPSIAVGGGMDVVLTRPFAWRIVAVEYGHAWLPDVASIHPQNTFRISTGAVLRIGTW